MQTDLIGHPPAAAGSDRPPLVSRYTYRYHLRAELLNNLFLGVFELYEVIARKGLKATDLEIIVLTTASTSFMIFTSFWAFRMEGRSKNSFIMWAAILGRGALLLVALTTGSMIFIFLCCAVFLSDTAFRPAQNSIFQANYDPGWRGRMLGRVTLWTRGLFILGALGCGALLDRNPSLYRILFPVAGVVGMISYAQYALIRIRRRDLDPPSRSENTVLKFMRILRENPDFDRFERNYFVYGIAFMMLLPTNVFLLVDLLQVSYSEFSTAKLVLFHVAYALMAPMAGRLFDRWNAVRMAGVSFLILTLYPLTLFAAFLLKSLPLAYAGFAIFGIAMSGVMTSWSLGAITFSGNKDSASFMGVHGSAVGVRGLFAPFLGYVVSRYFSMGATYLISAVLFLTASMLMFRLNRTAAVPPSPSKG